MLIGAMLRGTIDSFMGRPVTPWTYFCMKQPVFLKCSTEATSPRAGSSAQPTGLRRSRLCFVLHAAEAGVS